MMKKCIIAILAALALASCDPTPVYFVGDHIDIKIDVKQVSAGYLEVNFEPSVDTYFLSSVEKVIPGVDPDKLAKQFMDLAVDSAYVEYVQWRHEYLMQLEDNVADFPSHSLEYGETTVVYNFLQPDTDYWVFGFVVDPESNKPAGRLFWTTVHTASESKFKDIRFRYRIRGGWTYVYPYGEKTTLATDIPYVTAAFDSLDVREWGYDSPGALFDALYPEISGFKEEVRKGVYASLHDGFDDIEFLEGHTYYTCIATVDGPRNESFDVYKFCWTGYDMEAEYTDKDSTGGDL